MLAIVSLSVVLGVASAAPQFFSPEPVELSQARQNFIAEYNRLAKLAADAPDIHIIMSNRLPHQVPTPNTIVEQAPTVVTHHHQTPVAPIFDQFAFRANLGVGQQFAPSTQSFNIPAAATHQQTSHQTSHQAGHLAGHLAGHNPAPTAPLRWNGPFAHTVPAGVNGLPTQVMDTDAVKAAKAAHFAAHNRQLALVPQQFGNAI